MPDFHEKVQAKVAELREVAASKMAGEIGGPHSKEYQDTLRNYPEADNSVVAEAGIEEYLKTEYLIWIDEAFERAAGFPNPDRCETSILELTSICGEGKLVEVPKGAENKDELSSINFDGGSGSLASGLFDQISGIQDAVVDWEAGAADIFRDTFLPALPMAATNQMMVAKNLRNVMAANQEMIQQARADTIDLIDNTVAAIESDDGCCGGDGDVMATLKIVAGVASIAGGIATIPFSAGTTSTFVASGATMLAGSIATIDAINSAGKQDGDDNGGADEAKEKQMKLADDAVEATLDNMYIALQEIYSQLDTGNEELTWDCLKSVTYVMTNEKLGFLAPRPPAVANATTETVRDIVESDRD